MKVTIGSELARFTILEAAFDRYAENLIQNILNSQSSSGNEEINFYPDLFYYIETIGRVERSPFFKNAFRALIHAITTINYSSNYLNRVDTCYNPERFTPESIHFITYSIEHFRRIIFNSQNNNILSNCDCLTSRLNFTNCASSLCDYLVKGNPFFKLSQQDKIIPYGRLGNCLELSGLCFKYLLKEQNPFLNIEKYHIQDGDHVFFVIGRDRESDPQNPSTWGLDALVVDLWTRQIYLANDVSRIIKNCIGVVIESGLPVLESYNPLLKPVEIVAGNFVSVNQLRNVATSKFLDEEKEALESLKSLLKAFFQETHRENQKEIAMHILSLLDGEKMVFFSSFAETITLRSQMQFFLTLKVGKKAQVILSKQSFFKSG